MVTVARVRPGTIADELGIKPGTELLAVNGRELADFLDWEFLTADDELVIEARLPDGEEIVYEIERPEGEALGVELEPPTVRRCANRCEFCFIEGLPQGAAEAALHPRRRLPAVVRLRQLRDALEREGARHRADPRVPAVAALRLGARDAVGSAQGAAQQPARPEHRRAAHAARRGRHPVPLPDGGRARASTTATCSSSRSRDLWNLGDAVLSVALVPVGRHAVLASVHGQVRWTRRTPAASSTPSSGGRRARSPSAATAGCSAPTSCTCSPDATAARRRALRRLRADRERRRRGRLAARARARRARRRCRGSTAGASASSPASRWRRSCPSCSMQLASSTGRDVRADSDRELAVRPDDDHRRAARRRGHSPRARRPPRPRPRADSRRDDQRRRPLPRRRALHRAARDAADAGLSLVRLHRRAGARGRAARCHGRRAA